MSNYKFETLQLHVGQEQADPATDARAVPIYQTTSYVFKNSAHAAARFGLADAGNIYGRLTNSTQDVLEKRIAALEGGVAALATASGAAAITYTIEALAQNGDHIVAQKTIYGGSYNLLAHTLPQYGITATFVNAHDLQEVEAAIQPNTKAVYLETLGNPNSDIPDIDAIAAIAHKHGLPLVIDNTFGTPYLIRPIEHGADIVVHSATKFIGGHGTTLGGIIVDSGKFDWKASGKYAPIAEPNPSYHGVSFVDAAGPCSLGRGSMAAARSGPPIQPAFFKSSDRPAAVIRTARPPFPARRRNRERAAAAPGSGERQHGDDLIPVRFAVLTKAHPGIQRPCPRVVRVVGQPAAVGLAARPCSDIAKSRFHRPLAEPLPLEPGVDHEPPDRVVPLCDLRLVRIADRSVADHQEAHRPAGFVQAERQSDITILAHSEGLHHAVSVGRDKSLFVLFGCDPQADDLPDIPLAQLHKLHGHCSSNRMYGALPGVAGLSLHMLMIARGNAARQAL